MHIPWGIFLQCAQPLVTSPAPAQFWVWTLSIQHCGHSTHVTFGFIMFFYDFNMCTFLGFCLGMHTAFGAHLLLCRGPHGVTPPQQIHQLQPAEEPHIAPVFSFESSTMNSKHNTTETTALLALTHGLCRGIRQHHTGPLLNHFFFFPSRLFAAIGCQGAVLLVSVQALGLF